MATKSVAEGTPVPKDDEEKSEDAKNAAQDDEDSKGGKAPKDEKIGKAGDDAPEDAKGQAIGKAEAGQEDHEAAAKVPVKRLRLDI